jgi:transcription antitermination factor NusG
MKRVNENPPSRFPARTIAEASAPWWVAKVKPRQEKAIAFDFMKNEIEYYLPLVTKITRRKDNNKPRKSVLPLFPGYISFCSQEANATDVYKTGRVVSIIEIRHQRKFGEELSQIYQALESGVALEPLGDTSLYPPGTKVFIHAGPLRGIQGVITRVQDSDRLVLSVAGLGQASMLIDAAFVKPIPVQY